MSDNDPLQKIISTAMSRVASRVAFQHSEAPGDSPIEKLFFTALVVGATYVRPYMRTEVATSSSGQFTPRPDGIEYIHVVPQAQIGEYRVDFLVAVYDLVGAPLDADYTPIYDEKYWKFLVVECDGHDFHERTKEQAARDRKRDRDLSLRGYRVFRFTGSEIWADPIKCATDVLLWSENL